MRPWAESVQTVTLFAEDLAATRQFYLDVFDVTIMFEDADSAVFKLGELQFNLLDVAQAPELITPAPVAGRDPGARSMIMVEVPDVDARCQDLIARGVTLLNGPVDRWWGVRTAAFADPAGHMWEIAQPIQK
jgi:catechol 2,3-dioxygenase-like lactoylglutathione lyase family enzyme